jgi:hypothetical protein
VALLILLALGFSATAGSAPAITPASAGSATPSAVPVARPAAVAAPAPAPVSTPPPASSPPRDVRPTLPFKAPPGTRWIDGRYRVGSGLAEATRFVERQLDRAGIAFARRGPYRVRGVEVTRFLSEDPSTSWLAIHLVRKEGRTFLDLIPRTSEGTP